MDYFSMGGSVVVFRLESSPSSVKSICALSLTFREALLLDK